jgi:thymidylate synthase
MSEHEEYTSLLNTDEDNDTIYRHEEYQYLDLINDIVKHGFFENGRNGKTKSIFGSSMRFSLKNDKIPILTTKKVAWKTCLKELLWFIHGDTDNKVLQEQNVHIWDGNSSKEFMKTRGLEHYPEGILGPIYGYQWRCFNKSYHANTMDNNSKDLLNVYNNETDQLQFIIDQLKNPETRNSRRLIMTAWNPCQLNEMALPPCHVLCQFNVHDGNKLSCSMYQRSCDVPVGSPFNIASYSFLTHLLAKHCDLVPYEFIYFMGNCHIYEEHLDLIKQQLSRKPYDFPTLEILKKRENINDYVVDDFKIIGYKSHELIKMKMVA